MNFYHMAQNEAIFEGILHQRGSKDVTRFLSSIVMVASKIKLRTPVKVKISRTKTTRRSNTGNRRIAGKQKFDKSRHDKLQKQIENFKIFVTAEK